MTPPPEDPPPTEDELDISAPTTPVEVLQEITEEVVDRWRGEIADRAPEEFVDAVDPALDFIGKNAVHFVGLSGSTFQEGLDAASHGGFTRWAKTQVATMSVDQRLAWMQRNVATLEEFGNFQVRQLALLKKARETIARTGLKLLKWGLAAALA